MAKILNDFSQDSPSGTIYHYTTQHGLLGIVKHHELWATNIQYLNDEKEFGHSVELAKEELNSRTESIGSGELRRKLTRMKLGITAVLQEFVDAFATTTNICVISFSSVSDSLSQWRAYGDDNTCYAIGFDGHTLKEHGQRHGFSLVKCIYESSQKTNIINEVIDNALERPLSTHGKDEKGTSDTHLEVDDYAFVEHFIQDLVRVAPVLKHEKFHEESEWRLVSDVSIDPQTEEFAFRPGYSVIKPFFKFRIDVPELITSVTVGPARNKELAASSVQLLLNSQDMDAVDVELTDIPYRNWH